jgi:hypothetical protein
MKKNLLILFALTFFYQFKAQDLHEAPSLQVGLSGIKFSKGNLDPELIAEIIAEKQKEVKVKLIKNMLLNNLGVDNGLFYAYIDQSIEILTTEKDEDTRVKNLLENTVNLSFVVGYAEYYLQTLKKDSPEWKSIRELALSYGVSASLFEKDKLSLKDFAKITYRESVSEKSKTETDENFIIEQNNKFVGVIIDLFAEVIRQNEQLKTLGILRTNYLQNYLSMNSYVSLEDNIANKDLALKLKALDELLNGKKNEIERQALASIQKSLVDKTVFAMDSSLKVKVEIFEKAIKSSSTEISKFISDNETKLELEGYSKNQNYLLMNYNSLEGATNSFYELIKSKYNIDALNILKGTDKDLKNQYRIFEWYLDSKVKSEFYNSLFTKRTQADAIFSQIKGNLDIYLKYFGLVKSLSVKGNDWNEILKTISNDFNCGDAKAIADSMMVQYGRARKEIKDISMLSQSEINDIEQINSFLDKLRFAELNRFEYMQAYEKELKPALTRLGKYSLDFLKMNNSMFSLINCITKQVETDLASVNINLNLSFIKLLSTIDEFDHVPTYATFLNHLSDAGDVFSDEEMRKSINRVISFIRSYVKVGEDNNGKLSLNLDVEGFLYSLQKTPYNHFRPIQFHFTVGANTTSFSENLITNSSDTLRNYSFIGEKIGIKFKLWDYKYVRSFGKGETFSYWKFFRWWMPIPVKATYIRNSPPKEPTISNIHLLAYGSGILYNLVNTGTTKSFNSPLVGVGVGITFFNDLDVNVSWGKTILNSKSFTDPSVPSFFNVGFDIQFIEYYDRLNKKRKATQIQKKIASATN